MVPTSQVTGVAAPSDTLGETATQKLEGSAVKPPIPMALKCIIEISKIDSRMAQAKAWLLPRVPGCLTEVWTEWNEELCRNTGRTVVLTARAGSLQNI